MAESIQLYVLCVLEYNVGIQQLTTRTGCFLKPNDASVEIDDLKRIKPFDTDVDSSNVRRRC